ncbi:YwmB family TATA-box binding protein [Brevibacillus ruminantium]|uniref:YwmB family TATA-box binding protein n=1 Tax=Brevibacillus ruminantium TaxID=2950604 RepID=A0ABY4WES2_9BACL|nr:YwmB family TATA-box binding protein [Brevibacillus ruminantium]USG65394.1 YwmB family TATA-box binding protein [Brevibacillus ruminantium]
MGKRTVWGTLLLVVALGTAWFMPAEAKPGVQTERPAARLVEAIEGSGAEGVSVEVRTRISLGELSTPEEVKELASLWAKRLGFALSEASWVPARDLYQYQILSSPHGVELDFQVTGVSHGNGIDTYLVLSIKGNRNSLPYVDLIQKSHEQAFRQAGLVPQFSTCIRGMYNGKLSVDQQEGRILSIFSALHAKEVERMQDETVVSISGFTPEWKPFLSLNGQAKMNLQIATHRDDEAGTWITAGMPIITAEY